MAHRIEIRSTEREQLVDITARVQETVAELGLRDGVLHLWCLHTTCALTVNEGADPDVAEDIVGFMHTLVPRNARFAHAEGNSDSHVKTSLFGPGITLPVERGRLLLGTWQHIFLAEWDGPRTRTIVATPIASA
jgi:secondary thiamine-phosphate synthase enzyme